MYAVVHFLFILTKMGLWRICKEEGGSVSKFYKNTSEKKKSFLSQRRLYEYTKACLQWDQWSVQIIQKTFVKWIDVQGLHWIKIFHFNVLFTFGQNRCNKALPIQCNSASKRELNYINFILSKMNSSSHRWDRSHYGLNWERCVRGLWALGAFKANSNSKVNTATAVMILAETNMSAFVLIFQPLNMQSAPQMAGSALLGCCAWLINNTQSARLRIWDKLD